MLILHLLSFGESSKKISKDTKQTCYDIPWKEIAGMRETFDWTILNKTFEETLKNGTLPHNN